MRRTSEYLSTARMTATAEDQELRVIVRRVAGFEQVLAGIGGHRPVVVLAAAVDAGEGLLMQQAGQAVLVGGRAQDLHDQVLVIGRQVAVFEDRGDFILAGAPLRYGGF